MNITHIPAGYAETEAFFDDYEAAANVAHCPEAEAARSSASSAAGTHDCCARSPRRPSPR